MLYRETVTGACAEPLDPMVAAIGLRSTPVSSVKQIPGQLEQIDSTFYRTVDLTNEALDALPFHMRRMVRLGEKAVRIMNRLAFIKPKRLF